MLSPSQFSPETWDDMRAIVAYIATDNPDAAARFVPALEKTYAQLEALPGMGSVRHFGRKDLRGYASYRSLDLSTISSSTLRPARTYK